MGCGQRKVTVWDAGGRGGAGVLTKSALMVEERVDCAHKRHEFCWQPCSVSSEEHALSRFASFWGAPFILEGGHNVTMSS